MKIAYVCSNYIPTGNHAKKGTEVFNYTLINGLSRISSEHNLEMTAFASGDSDIPVKIESVNPQSSTADPSMPHGKHIIMELALISKAFSMQDQFDLYHINIGDGDIALPFSPFVKKPILITIHHLYDANFTRRYFDLYKNNPNVFFISVSNAQRKILPEVHYAATIHHGVDTGLFGFNEAGGEKIMWAGRTIPEKCPDVVVEVAKKTQKEARLFGIANLKTDDSFQKAILDMINSESTSLPISLEIGLDRLQLISHFQTSKVFLFPVSYEESFGLVLIESMSCGTPVVAYARGSIPEIIKDGVTGFIVNESDSDIRGDFIIKKTGIAGLQEAVEKIYNMPADEYLTMRKACREHVEKNFTFEKMAESYAKVYQDVISLHKESTA